MDGIALAHHIRQRWPPTILVVSSGNRAPHPSELPQDTEFLAKPVGKSSLDKLLQNIERKLTAA
jgi:CheY-like chemotaxis protein